MGKNLRRCDAVTRRLGGVVVRCGGCGGSCLKGRSPTGQVCPSTYIPLVLLLLSCFMYSLITHLLTSLTHSTYSLARRDGITTLGKVYLPLPPRWDDRSVHRHKPLFRYSLCFGRYEISGNWEYWLTHHDACFACSSISFNVIALLGFIIGLFQLWESETPISLVFLCLRYKNLVHQAEPKRQDVIFVSGLAKQHSLTQWALGYVLRICDPPVEYTRLTNIPT